MKLRVCLLGLCAWIEGISFAHAQQPAPESKSADSQIVNAPQPKPETRLHAFFDTTNVTEFLSSATAMATEAGMSCSQQTAGVTVPAKTCQQIAVGAGITLAAEVLASAVLHKTDHHAIERTSGPALVIFQVGRMVWISTHRK